MDAFSDTTVHTVVFMSSSQVGKTEILLNVLGYYIDQDPSPILITQPTLDMAEAFSKDRLAPMVRDTDCLSGRIADPRARDSGNTLLHKRFPGGHVTMAGANSPSSLASRPVRVYLADEIDRYPASAGTEGDPINLGDKRTATFWNRKRGRFSTPTIKGFSRIEREYDRSDQRVFEVPCPHCDEHQILRWANVCWDEGRPETARYACEHCGSLIEEAAKPKMLRRGRWVARAPFKGVAGFWVNELYSPWRRWAEVAADFLAAKDNPETLKTWINTSLGESWEEKGDKETPVEALKIRREPYTVESVPGDVLAITAGVDVQDDRLEIEIVGWGEKEQSWGIEYLTLPGNPSQPELWERLDTALKEHYLTDDGRALRIRAVAVDSGGHHTQQVYEFCTPRAGRRIWAIKGREGAHPVWPRRPSKSRTHKGHELRMIGADTAKDTVYTRWSIAPDEPGYCHLPDSYSDEWCKQAVIEQRITKRNSKGRRVRAWVCPPGKRNEASDCRVYAYAALVGAQQEGAFKLKSLAKLVDRQREVIAAEPQAAKSPVPKSVPRAVSRRPRARFRIAT